MAKRREAETVSSPTPVIFNEVKFANFPVFMENGVVTGYPLLSCAVAEDVANTIPEEFKSAVVIDWTELDSEKLLNEYKDANGVQSPFASDQEAEEAEQKLIKAIFGND